METIEAKLKTAVEIADIAGALTAPLTRSIAHLLKVAANAVGTEEASVIVRDGNEGDLKFLMAIGEVADQLLRVKIPAGKGVAGFVFSSGQSMVVADVGQESAFYAEVDKQTGYSTQTMLATPLRFEDEIIGVLEFVNRKGAPPFAPFTPDEMDIAALFADAIATLIDSFEQGTLIENVGERILKSTTNEENLLTLRAVRKWLKTVRSSDEHREMLELATLVGEIANRGAAERKFCKEILEAFTKYDSSNENTSFLNF